MVGEEKTYKIKRPTFFHRYLPAFLFVTTGIVVSVILFRTSKWITVNHQQINQWVRSFSLFEEGGIGVMVLSLGICLTLFFSIYLFLTIRRSVQFEQKVSQRTEELTALNEELSSEISKRKRLERLKDEFVSTVSHEIRTPLTLIKSSISNLKDGVEGPLTPRQIRLVEQTNRHINRLTRIISDLLDLSRLESGKAKMNRRQLDTKALLQEVVHSFEVAIKEKELKLETAFAPDIPPIYGDEDMILQVFNNLVNNAIRFAKSSITILANVVSQDEDSGAYLEERPAPVQLTVMDDGAGIEEKHLVSLFQKFEQINRPSGGDGYKGTGLGLAICREIVSLHHGKIWAESQVGSGTKFHFTLHQ